MRCAEAAGFGRKANLYGVSFIDALNGWIVGTNGLCLRTTDGGDHLTALNLASKATLRAVQFYGDGTAGRVEMAIPPPLAPPLTHPSRA